MGGGGDEGRRGWKKMKSDFKARGTMWVRVAVYM